MGGTSTRGIPRSWKSMPYAQERSNRQTEPAGELASRTLAMPANTNPLGDIFGGWIMSLMDSAAKMSATQRAHGRVVTAAVSNIVFRAPIKVGDRVCCYNDSRGIGRSYTQALA